MSRNRNDYDSFKDVAEFQQNMYNPGHYIGTGRVPPTVSAPGNAMPLAVLCFLGFVLFTGLGFLMFFSDANITSSGLIESPLANKIIGLIIMLGVALLFLFFGFAYLKKARRYRKQKRVMEEEEIDEAPSGEILQKTCPKCGETHDFDYPKCPNCKYNYF